MSQGKKVARVSCLSVIAIALGLSLGSSAPAITNELPPSGQEVQTMQLTVAGTQMTSESTIQVARHTEFELAQSVRHTEFER